jgi:hypothetical protein
VFAGICFSNGTAAATNQQQITVHSMITIRPDAFNPSPDFVASQFGAPAFDRRLSDKILAAHNHAYAVGDAALAEALMAQLERSETAEREAYKRKSTGSFRFYSPRQSSAVKHGRLWRGYVDARNVFNALNLQAGTPSGRLVRAEKEMQRRYAKWALA